jgi:hypothetical protein
VETSYKLEKFGTDFGTILLVELKNLAEHNIRQKEKFSLQ